MFCAPAFLPTSFTLSSKLCCEIGMWESSFSNSEQNRRTKFPWRFSFLWMKHAIFVKNIFMPDFQFKSTSCLLHESAGSFQKSGFEDFMCSAFRLWAKSQLPTTYASSLLRNPPFKSNLALRKRPTTHTMVLRVRLEKWVIAQRAPVDDDDDHHHHWHMYPHKPTHSVFIYCSSIYP